MCLSIGKKSSNSIFLVQCFLANEANFYKKNVLLKVSENVDKLFFVQFLHFCIFLMYLALCGPVLWSSKDDEARRLESAKAPDSKPRGEEHVLPANMKMKT